MIRTVNEFDARLNGLDPEDSSFVLQTDELVTELLPSIADKVFPAILRFFERYPNADFGAPGTLVHHMETYYPNYVEALLDSVNRKPSFCGALMINRILNSNTDPKLRSQLVKTLHGIIINDQQLATYSLKMVQGFIERHSLDLD